MLKVCLFYSTVNDKEKSFVRLVPGVPGPTFYRRKLEPDVGRDGTGNEPPR
jgi:hypothetical protein